MTDTTWRLIAPAEDAASARPISPDLVAELEVVAKQLGLRYSKDSKARKLYLGLPKVTTSKPSPTGGLVYPSGNMAERHPANNDPRYAPARPAEAAPLVRVSPDLKVSKNFSLSEFRPQSSVYDGVRVHPDLVDLLERIRAAAGCPIRITSGYRPPAYNQHVGGVANSNHMDGLAADIYADALNVSQLRAVCEKVMAGRGGLGYYPTQNFCHVDVGAYSRWQG